uniref:Copia protein n=1 Tax=Tanacetum cinerariifolium TaxID=118510 RepID=A0A699HEF4_TANCI|nr:copia protein [Tanacetum cinerariifolium]
MIGNLNLLINFIWKFLGTILFGNDHVAVILGFGDLQWGNILITRVYFVEGLGHNLFSVGQFCDLDLKVAFRRNACFIRNLEGVDLLLGNRTTNLYTINLHEMASASPIFLMARATSTKSWLWHQRLSHLNFDTINDLAKNDIVSGLSKFKYHKEHLCPSSIASACFTQNRSIIYRRFNKTPYELINGRKPYISFLHVFGALCYPKNDHEDIGKLGAKGFIGYSIDSCAYRVFNRRTKKTIETMNVTFDELSAELSNLGLQSMTYGKISSGLDLTYAPSTITTQQPTKGDLDLLFEAMYDDYIGGQPSTASLIVPAAQDVDGLTSQQQHAQQQENQAPIQPKTVADNVPNAMFDANTFVNPFVTPSTCFIDANHPSHVFKLKKALYGLKQAPRAWYDELLTFLLHNHFFKGTIDPTLFIRRFDDDILVVHVYVDDIIFGSTHPRLDIVHATCLCAWYQVKPTEKHHKEVKRIFYYLRGTVNTGLWYMKNSGFELTGFLDADYTGCKDTFKSTFGGAQLLGKKLVSWSLKKQDCTALSTAKAEYVSLSACCAQVLWIRTQLMDYGFHFNKIPIYCDSKSAIAISCNPVQHSRTKHVAVRFYFIKEHIEKGLSQVEELLKKEKKGELDTKLTGFQTASKNLDDLLESQRSDKNKEGLGYSAIPPPPAQVYSPPKNDMSWTGLSEFVDDTITDYSRPSPTVETVNMSLIDINASLTEHNLHQQCKLFSRDNSSTQ